MYLNGFENISLRFFNRIAKGMTTWQGRDKGVIALFIWFNNDSKLVFTHDVPLGLIIYPKFHLELE